MSIVPARIPTEAKERAVEIAKKVAEKLKAIGTIGIEMFLLEGETILVNEIAPRVHNSGHYTIEACYTSQFEQHLRAICGLPLGSTKLLSAVVMVNILGEELRGKKTMLSGIDEVLAIPGVNLHLYGKDEVRAGRKMGHINVLADSVSEAIQRAEEAKNFLCWS
jgi:5-(carboxyamino)imidazole ribonucleotide synthase